MLATLKDCLDFDLSFSTLKKFFFDSSSLSVEKMIENPVEWFQNKILELENDLKRKSALCEIKSMVLNSEKKVLNDIVRNVSIDPVFACLARSDDQDMELICIIISEMLCEVPAVQLLQSYGESILMALSHTSDEVKETALKLLEKNVDETAARILLKNYTSLLVDATACIASQNRSTAQGAISLLTKIGSCTGGLNVLYSDMVLNKLKEVMTTSDTARFRVYEIIVAVSMLSAENLSKGIASGLMDNLLSEISSSDILIQLNALELLSSLASSNHGLIYLQEHNVVQNLVDKLLKLNEEPLSVMLLPGLIEFFGNICTSQPEHFTSQYPQIMDLLFNSLDTNDEVLLGVIITAVGKIGSTHAGRLVLNNYGEPLKNIFFKRIGQILTTKNNITISAMNSLSELLKDMKGDIRLNEIAKEWFLSTPNALESTVVISKLPFVEFRVAAYALLKSIATQEWGVENLSHYPGMIEFLTDRSTEFNKDCKEMKFGIVYNMIQSPNIEKIINQQQLLILRSFVREGPFYVPTSVEMATEGAI